MSTTGVFQMPKKKGLRKGFEDPMTALDRAEGWEKKINFDSLRLYNKRHLREHKKMRNIPIHTYGVRPTSIEHAATWENIPEMTPELGNNSKITGVALIIIMLWG